MKVRTIVINGIFAALYIAVTAIIQPFGFTNVQFRVSEIFNHLVVFNKKYIYGVLLGVFIANLFMSPLGVIDLIFGGGMSLIALLLTIWFSRFTTSIWKRMLFNTGVFCFTMFLVALELHIWADFPFFFTWLTAAAGELVVMLVGMPIMYYLNKRINFEKLIEN